jgi:hypothetical protein
MATRKIKIKKTEDHSQVKALNPRDADQKYMGDEPLFAEQPMPENRGSAIARSLNWYHRFYSKKDARDMLATYLDFHDRVADGKVMRKVDDAEFRLPTFAWLSRMVLRGLDLTEHEMLALENEITRLLQTIHKPEVKGVSQFGKTTKYPDQVATAKSNIQETMREKAREAAGELEGLFDEYFLAGSPTKHSLRPMDEVSKKNVLPHHISMITEVWTKKLNEMKELLEGKDAQLVQAYAHYSKQQIKNTIKFIELVLSDLNSYITVKKAAKAPRARKAVPVEKQVAKMKFMKAFKDPAMKLDLISVSPVKLHGCSEAYLYDTQLRKLTYLVADDYSKTLTVRGTTILGFDSVKSQTKTLRKPAEQLKEVMGSKPAGRKFFESIKSVGITPKGRSNERTIIVKAW